MEKRVPTEVTLQDILKLGPCVEGLVKALKQLNWRLTAKDKRELWKFAKEREYWGRSLFNRYLRNTGYSDMRQKPRETYSVIEVIDLACTGDFDRVDWILTVIGISKSECDYDIYTCRAENAKRLKLAYLRRYFDQQQNKLKKVRKAA